MLEITNSFDLFKYLHKKIRLDKKRGEWWWPNAGKFEVVIGAILTQQTRWENVEISLKNLKDKGVLNIEALCDIDEQILQEYIKKSGFYRQKANRIKLLSKNISNEFSDFESFKQNVTRQWLLNQKGIGYESADSILNYACFREYMVVDNYTNRLVKKFGYEFDGYSELQEWLISGIIENLDKIYNLYNQELSLALIYAKFHGKIVEYSKLKD